MAVRFVVVDGAGPLTLSLARLLRLCGVARVDAGPWAADVCDAELRRTGSGPPDLVVLVGELDPRAAEPWRRRGVPHLPVTADAARVVVGPWLTADPDEPCLACMRLSRGDDAGARTPDDALVAMGAGMAAMVALAGLAAAGGPTGVSVEVLSPWPRVEHRRWSRHLDCPHHPDGGPGVVGRTRGDYPRLTAQPPVLERGQAVRAGR
jgi:hypothetical protein